MAIYRCSRCDELKDDDHFPCEEDPDNDIDLMCPACADELEDNQGRYMTNKTWINGLEIGQDRFIVNYVNGESYQYDVPSDEIMAMLNSKSAQTYFADNIKLKYDGHLMSGWEQWQDLLEGMDNGK